MFFKSLLRYKWYALSSLLMTSLMIASSLLLPWFLKHILDALQEQNNQKKNGSLKEKIASKALKITIRKPMK